MRVVPLKNRKWINSDQLLEHCKRVISEKENYCKEIIQEAQQLFDEYLSTGDIELTRNKINGPKASARV